MRWQTLWQARWIFFLFAVLAIISGMFLPILLVPLAGCVLFTLYFFRDPHRDIPKGVGLIVAPADGRVTDIGEMEETEVTGARMRRIGIFLSVFDVHVNRAPAAGRVVYTAEYAGDYHDARSPMASTHNAARTWGFNCEGEMIVVRQITGAIARRIVAWSMLGDNLRRGQRFGMIRFGSRTEIYLPLNAQILVRAGESVRGGRTSVARMVEKNVAEDKIPAMRKVRA